MDKDLEKNKIKVVVKYNNKEEFQLNGELSESKSPIEFPGDKEKLVPLGTSNVINKAKVFTHKAPLQFAKFNAKFPKPGKWKMEIYLQDNKLSEIYIEVSEKEKTLKKLTY